MVLTVKAVFSDAQRVKQHLQKEGLFLTGWAYDKDEEHIYFPVTKKFRMHGVQLDFVEKELEAVPATETLKDVLANELTPEELERLTSSYDVVGDIAIIEVDEELEKKEAIIAKAVLEQNKHVKTVLKKSGGHEGVLRTQEMIFLAGEDKRETVAKENGVRLHVNVERVYYSIRTATERKRVALQVKNGERVLVMFSGLGPYVCVIAKNTEAAEVVGIELNEAGHDLAVENARLNKLSNVTLINGDVRDVTPELVAKDVSFDRIVMPLPHTGSDFLDEAFSVAKKGATIHLYDFQPAGAFDKAEQKLFEGAERNKKHVTIKSVTACGQHSPRTFRVCVDFTVDE